MQDFALIHEFQDYLVYEKHFSEHTIKCYSADLRQFAGFLINQHNQEPNHPPDHPGNDSPYTRGQTQEHHLATATAVDASLSTDILEADVNLLRTFLAFLNNEKYSKATIARKLATLRSFYKYLVRKGRVASSPVTPIRTPKQDKRLPLFLSSEQITVLLNCPDTNDMLGSRDRAIMETLYSSGLRVS